MIFSVEKRDTCVDADVVNVDYELMLSLASHKNPMWLTSIPQFTECDYLSIYRHNPSVSENSLHINIQINT